jgi:hypothetical protein
MVHALRSLKTRTAAKPRITMVNEKAAGGISRRLKLNSVLKTRPVLKGPAGFKGLARPISFR